MAFSTIIRRASSSLKPLTTLTLGAQRSHISSLINPLKKPISYHLSQRPFLHSRHHFSALAAKKPTSDHSLVTVINSEIICAEESDDHNLVDATPEGFPFEIEDNLGQQTILLRREYLGEKIRVEVHMPDLVTGEEEDDDDEDDAEKSTQSSIPLVVTVLKDSGVSLVFDVTAYPDEVAIDSFSVKKADTSEDQIPYEGPDFSSLDENLQKAFHKYLEIRGIKPSTTNFLHEYMINKDSREYLVWLKNLKKFIEK